jgi:hypothetical protein
MGSPAGSFFHKGRVLRRVTHGLALALAVAAGFGAAAGLPPGATPPGEALFGGRPFQTLVDPSKTSIYLGSVSLTLSPFLWHDGTFAADYTAKVIPFFFFTEHGHVTIEFSDEQLRELLRGETVYFKGQARNSAGQERRVAGRAVPLGAGAARGKIKVRVHVGKVELIFNSAFRLAAVE